MRCIQERLAKLPVPSSNIEDEFYRRGAASPFVKETGDRRHEGRPPTAKKKGARDVMMNDVEPFAAIRNRV